MLPFPDGDFLFDPVDDVLVGGLRLATMRGCRDQWSMGLIFQVRYGFTPVIVADFSAKQDDSPCARMVRSCQHACYVEPFGA
jgi:hypothetical protein